VEELGRFKLTSQETKPKRYNTRLWPSIPMFEVAQDKDSDWMLLAAVHESLHGPSRHFPALSIWSLSGIADINQAVPLDL
jgi:hypothetical protein